MKPFDLSPAQEGLREIYPPVNVILDAIRSGDKDARYALARLWLSEGIPYCFKAQPALYESLRLWLSRRLGVQAKEITLVGSGRQGFSLTPGSDVGRPFGPHSDLDLAFISPPLFQTLEATFKHWEADYVARTVVPRTEQEKKFWDANLQSVPLGLARGFIDPYKVPTWDRYPDIQKIQDAMYCASQKLKATPDAPSVRKVSARVYSDWDSFVRQMAINLESLARKPLAE